MINCLVHKYVNNVIELIDGANLYYMELINLLRTYNNHKVNIIWHNVFSDLKNKNLVRNLKEADVVFCCVGPYAYIYHYFREKYDLDFRIIRDVQTAYWGGYILQELLCNPLTRKGDIILMPSYYTIHLFKKIFNKDLYLNSSIVFYPTIDKYPVIEKSRENRENQVLRIGYLGRVSKDKNFNQVLELSKQLARSSKVKLYVAGGVYRNQYNILRLQKSLKKHGILMYYEGYTNDIWNFFKKIDIFLFFSTSNVESLGRVVLEAIKLIPINKVNHPIGKQFMVIHNPNI